MNVWAIAFVIMWLIVIAFFGGIWCGHLMTRKPVYE